MSEPETALLDAVVEAIEHRGLLRGVRHLVVACSGGGDSVALAEMMVQLGPRFEMTVALAHLNHDLRGIDSEADEHHVRDLARRYGVACETGRLEDPDSVAGGLEERLRDARHRFLAEVVGRTGADGVALGHTLDDRVETLIMNLARGSGRRGLAGMRWRNRVGGLLLVRPLLGVRRERLRRYAQGRDVAWREDPSNADSRFTRNRVRNIVLPALEQALPGAVDRIGRAAELLDQDNDWLEGLVDEALARAQLDDPHPGATALDVSVLRTLPRALATRVLRRALAEVRGGLRGVHLAHVEAIVDRLLPGVESARDLPGVRARVEGARLRLMPLQNRRLTSADGV
ncbi:MAG TPA: tRNA lysidine(34) synthetase TilS [Acidobacteriota bacterium]|nr:tRNA lysidine(34) synthetase TilS [Acidobacteriota bacterium]